MELHQKTFGLLIVFLIAVLFAGINWAGLIPLWQTPDEQAHFAQAQDFAALGSRPQSGYSTSADIVLSEKYLGVFRDDRGNNKFTYHPEYNLEYTNSVYGLYEKEIAALPIESRKILSIDEAAGYPPLYYLYIAAINKQFWSLDLISRVFLSRVATVLLSVSLGLTVFHIGKILFKDIFFAFILASLVAFQPMRMFAGSGVTSDALYNAVYPLVVLAGLLFYRRPQLKRLILILAMVLVSIATKQQSALLFLWLVPVVIASAFRRGGGAEVITKISVILGIVFGSLMIAINVLATYIPDLVFPLTGTIFKESGIPDVSTYQLAGPSVIEYFLAVLGEGYSQMFPWYWGVYRWLSLTLPFWVYRAIKLVMIVSLAGWITGFRKIKAFADGKILLWLIASSLIYLVGIYSWNLLFWKSHGFPFGIQGRYFLPNLTEHMAVLLVGLLAIFPARLRKIAGFVSATLMVLFNWFSLWFVSESYYGSLFSYQTFFLRASQYKPWFFKTPLLEVWLGLGIITSIWFLWRMGVELNRSDESKVLKEKER